MTGNTGERKRSGLVTASELQCHATLELAGDRWALDGRDVGCPETLTNHLLRLADRTLGEAA